MPFCSHAVLLHSAKESQVTVAHGDNIEQFPQLLVTGKISPYGRPFLLYTSLPRSVEVRRVHGLGCIVAQDKETYVEVKVDGITKRAPVPPGDPGDCNVTFEL